MYSIACSLTAQMQKADEIEAKMREENTWPIEYAVLKPDYGQLARFVNNICFCVGM